METVVSPQDTAPRADEALIPLVPQDDKGPQDTKDALAKLAEEAARATAKLRPAAAANFSAGPRVIVPAIEPMQALAAGDKLVVEPTARPRSAGRGVVRFILAVSLGAATTLGWQSYGEAARQMVATYVPALAAVSAPSVTLASTGAGNEPDRAAPVAQTEGTPVQSQVPAAAVPPPSMPVATVAAAPAAAPAELTQQIESMANEIASLRDTVAKVSTTQDQMVHAVARLQAADEEARHKMAPPTPMPRAAPARKPLAAAPPPPPPAPVTQPVPRSTAQAVTSAPLPPLTAPAVTPVPELNRRPPAPMP